MMQPQSASQQFQVQQVQPREAFGTRVTVVPDGSSAPHVVSQCQGQLVMSLVQLNRNVTA
ncbi:hypothetical protein AO896_29500 [Pseudomonas aeruginosa]|nr:hypothetical protein BH596_16535 [Pseudomonas aeruginosa]OPD66910.1 hypothetical protein AO882_32965 [Pseudomonas paraeruginosa]OPD70267.1 hypothetical protein AO898_29635 [Pseudomonas aeruginosa]OPD70843.1 hypothetical protein AO896_29500 [Pseudomonas aeruginosa]OPD86968.1 hypothetical protein AO955_31170 [Pseudomonas aeruginosa]